MQIPTERGKIRASAGAREATSRCQCVEDVEIRELRVTVVARARARCAPVSPATHADAVDQSAMDNALKQAEEHVPLIRGDKSEMPCSTASAGNSKAASAPGDTASRIEQSQSRERVGLRLEQP